MSESLPWVHARYNVTTDSRLTILAGSSYGGLAATYAALRHGNRNADLIRFGCYLGQRRGC
jgi:enterochelin esterase-like enzyme